ncbi:AraC family transcriptional regulator [Leptolyngbya sp. FACHB-16]|uniref:helix-turn-helix transcriptional regulator n=1 Tax=unclassified Leptolyngbya TaxID=2650499 RepID=UPI001682AA7C|nr:AraC family transcriptional regulator [Leptolyngbya sp. FACHB-16]MBD2153015.1 helix-turn-helix transcriptional regulator [Leptolyngbya sp. FACHB-16]
MDFINADDYWKQWQEDLKIRGTIHYKTDGFDEIGSCQNHYSHDYFWRVRLRSGLILEFNDDTYHNPLGLHTYHDDTPYLTGKFYLSGHHQVLTPGVKGVSSEYEERVGHNYLFFLPDIHEVELFSANQRIQVLRLHFSLDFLRSLGPDLNFLPLPLQQLIESEQALRFHQPMGVMDCRMQTVLQQILNCPYQGAMKRLYLEGKALELVALQLEQWSSQTSSQSSSKRLRPSDIERLHEAKHILLRDLNNPPSLLELARQVGLNDYKLKVGFRSIFGTTVFGYVRLHRLERARQLLESCDMSVTQVAATVGYSSQGHFAAAFRKQFGVNPRSIKGV